MQTYLVTIIGKLYSKNVAVQATSRAEAMAQFDAYQASARVMWVEEVTDEE